MQTRQLRPESKSLFDHDNDEFGSETDPFDSVSHRQWQTRWARPSIVVVVAWIVTGTCQHLDWTQRRSPLFVRHSMTLQQVILQHLIESQGGSWTCVNPGLMFLDAQLPRGLQKLVGLVIAGSETRKMIGRPCKIVSQWSGDGC